MAQRPSIYGSYGIRGIWGKDIDSILAVKLAKAYVTMKKPGRVGVGRDGRVSSNDFAEAIIVGMRDVGDDVVDFGLVPVDAFYFAVDRYKCDGGAMVTASHNPPEWNGVKFVDARAQLLVGEKNSALGHIAEQGTFVPVSSHFGSYSEIDVIPDFTSFIVQAVDFTRVRSLRVVIDPGNGVSAPAAVALMHALQYKWSGINMDVHGLFPGRGPDPKEKGALVGLSRAVRDRGVDLGISFDADGDRMFLVDERGSELIGEETGIILARMFLTEHPGAHIVYNVVCSRIVPEMITAAGGIPIRAGVGSVNMVPAIVRSKAVMGIETSGHYIQRKYNCIDSGLLPAAFALRAIATDGRPLSKIREGLDPYAHDRVELHIEDHSKALDTIRQRFSDGIRDELDGITVEYPDWWFNVRPSRSEPYLRLTVEAKHRDDMERHRDELVRIIKGESTLT
ncbi:MAG: phosphomannomutase/phosphoglucomutase [Candidatus Kerfeldbacteria bacterium]